MLVTVLTSRSEQIDLNLREDATIGQLKQTLIHDFNYAPNVQIMYSTRMCRDDAAVDDYPPGTLIVIGARQAPPQPQYHPSNSSGYGAGGGGGAYDPYAQHGSSGGQTLRTGHSGGLRQAAEKKYADEYGPRGAAPTGPSVYTATPMSTAMGGGGGGGTGSHGHHNNNNNGSSTSYQQQHQPNAYSRFGQSNPNTSTNGLYGVNTAAAPHQQQQQQQGGCAQQYSPSPSNSYANYMSSAASRGADASYSGGMGGWGGGGRATTRSPARHSTSTSYGHDRSHHGGGGYAPTPLGNTSTNTINRGPPAPAAAQPVGPSTTYGNTRCGTGNRSTTPHNNSSYSSSNNYSTSNNYNNNNNNNTTSNAAAYNSSGTQYGNNNNYNNNGYGGSGAAASPHSKSEQPGYRGSPSAGRRASPPPPPSPQQQPSTPSVSTAEGEEDVVFPEIVLFATVIGQGPEQRVAVDINGGVSVREMMVKLAEIAASRGLVVTLSQEMTKLMFFNKYIRNWSDPIRRVPLLDKAELLVCTGIYTDEQTMTLHSAERTLTAVRSAIEAARTSESGVIPANTRNYLNEQCMKALLNLDSLQGVAEDVRARRKALVKEVTAIQDRLC